MRLVNPGSVWKNILNSPIFLVILCLGIFYLAYLNYRTISFLFVLQDRKLSALGDLQATEKRIAAEQISNFENNSEEAKKRYKKEFFNSLDKGEYVVFIHRDEAPVRIENLER